MKKGFGFNSAFRWSNLISKSSVAGGVALFLAVALPQAASAAPLTLVGPIAGNTLGPQSTSAPCIIAATQCQQPAGFGFNNFTSNGATSSYNMFSTTPTANVPDGVQGTPYTVAQIRSVVGNFFNIAIDVNTTGAASETLQVFQVIINNAVAYDFNGPFVIGNVNNNGNGFGDYSLNTVNLTGLSDASTVLFRAFWTNAVDGGESYFLTATTGPSQVPEPSPLLLLGAGITAVGVLLYRKKN